MRKIPTLFRRDVRYVIDEVNPAAAWVLEGEGVATRKYDGTCVMLDDNRRWWARREVKTGRPVPALFVPVETDANTGKPVGWEPIEDSGFYKWFQQAHAILNREDPGTYELIGPKVNGNPEAVSEHTLIRHAKAAVIELHPTVLNFGSLRELMRDLPYEGIVWHHSDGRMAKLKRRDFP